MLLPKHIEEAINHESFNYDSEIARGAFVNGVTWLYEYLLKAAPEFDELAAGNEGEGWDEPVCFVDGAEWQYNQLAAQIAALKVENQSLADRYKSVELANSEMTKNDHATFGEMLIELSTVRAQMERSDKALKQMTKYRDELAEEFIMNKEILNFKDKIARALTGLNVARTEIEHLKHKLAKEREYNEANVAMANEAKVRSRKLEAENAELRTKLEDAQNMDGSDEVLRIRADYEKRLTIERQITAMLRESLSYIDCIIRNDAVPNEVGEGDVICPKRIQSRIAATIAREQEMRK